MNNRGHLGVAFMGFLLLALLLLGLLALSVTGASPARGVGGGSDANGYVSAPPP